MQASIRSKCGKEGGMNSKRGRELFTFHKHEIVSRLMACVHEMEFMKARDEMANNKSFLLKPPF